LEEKKLYSPGATGRNQQTSLLIPLFAEQLLLQRLAVPGFYDPAMKDSAMVFSCQP
jgi:hypothetical protein